MPPHSYVPASAQEALLHVFLNERVASDLSVLADRLRSGAQPTPPVVPLRPAALTVAPVLQHCACQLDFPGPPSSPSAAPLAGDPADPMPDADSAAPLFLPRMPELESPPVRAALARLDQVDLPRVLQQRRLFFQSPPKFLRGPFRAALSLVLRAIDSARPDNETEQTRAWILSLLLPRLLLHRRPGGTA